MQLITAGTPEDEHYSKPPTRQANNRKAKTMNRTTVSDVRAAFSTLQTAMRVNGITRTVTIPNYDDETGDHVYTFTADDLRFEQGSPTYGRGWRMYYLDPYNGAHYSPAYGEYLGWSAREAYDTLRHLAEGVWWVR